MPETKAATTSDLSYDTQASIKLRARLLLAIIFIFFIALAGRLVKLQHFDHNLYAAKNANLIAGKWRWSAWRGDIIDTRGRLLATSIRSHSCAIDPKIVVAQKPGLEWTLTTLAETLDLSPQKLQQLRKRTVKQLPRFVVVQRQVPEIIQRTVREKRLPGVFFPLRTPNSCVFNPARAAKSARGIDGVIHELTRLLRLSATDREHLRKKSRKRRPRFVWIKRHLSEEAYQKARELRLPGVQFPPEYKRSYPNATTGSHIIGFADLDGVGLEGIEKVCNPLLLGLRGSLRVEKDAARRRLVTTPVYADPTQKGLSVKLSIDSTIQMVTEEELNKAVKAFRGPDTTGCALVVNPYTGDILALANYPTFDSNNPTAQPISNRLNRSVATIAEPGSTFKSFVLGTALDEKKVTLDTSFFCENGAWRMSNGRVLHDSHGYGDLTARMILVKSSNIGIAKIAARLGMRRLYRMVRDFGFGEISGIALPAELKGVVHPLKKWTSYSMGSIPMGQEIATTPLQLAMAYCAIANDGELLKPRIVQSVYNSNGKLVKHFGVVRRRRVLTPWAARKLRGVLRQVVTDGTAKRAQAEDCQIGGKTGTAQLPANLAERRAGAMNGYSPTRYAATFVGMAPYQRPVVVVLVQILAPVGSHYGGTVSAPAVRNISVRTLAYLKASQDNR